MKIFPESTLVPYQVSPLPNGKKWLVFAPHADDEIFGMGGTLLLAKEQQVQIILVIMTNGQLGSNAINKADIVDIRRQEALKIAEQVGFHKVLFLDEQDRKLSPKPELVQKVSDIIVKEGVDTLFIPAPFEYHPDHRVTTQIVWEAIRDSGYQATLYGYEITTQSPANMLLDISKTYKEKIRLMKCYQSQVNNNNYIEVVCALNKSRTFSLPEHVSYAEGFFKFNPESSYSPSEQAYQFLEKYMQGLNHNIACLSRISFLEMQLKQLSKEQAALLNSSSWKITSLLRWLKQLFI